MSYMAKYAQNSHITRRLYHGYVAIKQGATWEVVLDGRKVNHFYSLWSANEWSRSQCIVREGSK